jgi:hypothetical protein
MPFDATHADSYERRCRSQLSCVGGYYRVRETVEEVRALMGAGDKTPWPPPVAVLVVAFISTYPTGGVERKDVVNPAFPEFFERRQYLSVEVWWDAAYQPRGTAPGGAG